MSGSDQPVPAARRRTAIIAGAVLIATFVAGMLAGVAADRLVIMRMWRDRMPARAPHFVAERLERRLDLTADQRRQVEEIIQRHHSRMNEVWNSARPAVRAEVDAANAEIEKILTPGQREKFSRFKMRMGPRGGPGHGGPPRGRPGQGAGF